MMSRVAVRAVYFGTGLGLALLSMGADRGSCAPANELRSNQSLQSGLTNQEACAQVLPPPMRNPDTGECVQFGTACEVPEGWEPCGCLYEGQVRQEGESFPSSDGCNICTCSDGNVLCTERACVDECDLTCPYGRKTDSNGHAYCECKESEFCIMIAPPPHRNPETGECVPFPTVCDIPTGWQPCDRDNDERAQCESTGGRWDDASCGHYVCGERPLCKAIIPGCDCGAGANFVGTMGCVPDRQCNNPTDPTAICYSSADCAAGSACVACPDEGAPRCEPLVCSFDADCPAGSHCEGSSVCPPDVVCVWRGLPGQCIADR